MPDRRAIALDRARETEAEARQIVDHFVSHGYLRGDLDPLTLAREFPYLTGMLPFEQRVKRFAEQLQIPRYAVDLTPDGRPARVRWSTLLAAEPDLTAADLQPVRDPRGRFVGRPEPEPLDRARHETRQVARRDLGI
jgi:hypothetical protein